ncbi:hypothetical protein NDN08_003060 [Rhodosorus marinus]|uniref:Putative gamma-glutamylcyclotransferase n=1 Tax=Rhodosorus marinus TaxID=101924 RepID=A0AAV8UZZ1_9RHOD|nr:hypothetical protein NDN08_003060 [Rhodosorus marinus]
MSKPEIGLFVYGTLISPKVCARVLDRVPEGYEAVLNGYRRLNGRLYPAIKPDPDGSIRGRVILVAAAEISKLDYFEADEYLRREEKVRDADSGEERTVQVYVGRQFIYHDMNGEWDFEKFEREHLVAFLGDTDEYLNHGDENNAGSEE